MNDIKVAFNTAFPCIFKKSKEVLSIAYTYIHTKKGKKIMAYEQHKSPVEAKNKLKDLLIRN